MAMKNKRCEGKTIRIDPYRVARAGWNALQEFAGLRADGLIPEKDVIAKSTRVKQTGVKRGAMGRLTKARSARSSRTGRRRIIISKNKCRQP